MSTEYLKVDGLVGKPLTMTCEDFARIDPSQRVEDVSQVGAKRAGQAVRIAAILEMANVSADVTHLGLHGTRDNFHASIPLAPVLARGLIIYAAEGQSLSVAAGGPFRFFIPDHAACHMDEIDECANVKYLDRIELTQGKGSDNRPQDDDEHARLHEKQ